MLAFLRRGAGPMPESWRIWGVWMAPAERITSRRAEMVMVILVLHGVRRTPVAVVLAKRMRLTLVPVRRS